MKKLTLFIASLVLCIGSATVLAGAVHNEHAGRNPNTPNACKEAKVGKFNPPALAEVVPGSDFSFMLFDAHHANHVEVTVKKIVVPVTFEKKGELTVVHGKLPESLKGTAARIVVKIKGKLPKCNMEEGWLIKISE
jgi:hypothetical protein